jgi:hypothetical protein
MKYYDWNDEKNEWLKKKRGVSFEMVEIAIESGDLLDRVKHTNQEKYPHQKVLFVKIDHIVYAVPCVEDSDKIFLKTIFPSRKATKRYLESNR